MRPSKEQPEEDEDGPPLTPLKKGMAVFAALLMGVGALKAAFEGLIDGTISGAKGAVFTWSFKPVQFVLIEAFLIILGGLLLWFSWASLFAPPKPTSKESGSG
jgi:hypothetical protein